MARSVARGSWPLRVGDSTGSPAAASGLATHDARRPRPPDQALRNPRSPRLSAVRRALHRLAVRHLLGSELLARAFPFRQPPILLASFPRSGSSWLGRILATSPEIAYLREPVNQEAIRRDPTATLARMDEEKTRRMHLELAAPCFYGRVPRGLASVPHIGRFLPGRRHRVRLLIKEVNPYAALLYLERFRPDFLFLTRHPAAIADSFLRRGWDLSDWRSFGREVGEVLQTCVERRLSMVAHEKLASNPEVEIPALFDHLGLRRPPDLAEVIVRFCRGTASGSPYAVERESADLVERWRRTLPSPVADAVLSGLADSGAGYPDASASIATPLAR